MRQPLISVVIPAYNAARTLEATVRSALAQTVSDLEIIVVDDGSKDDTLAVARRIGDPRIRVTAQANRGAAAARNTGIEAATGKYIAFLDADDLWVPHKLERQILVLESDPAADAVQAGAYFVDDQLRVLSVHPCRDSGRSFVESLLFQNLPAFLSTLVVRRDRLIEVGMFDSDLEMLEEWDMALKVSRYCGMRSIEEPLVLYRVHEGNRHRNVDNHVQPGSMILERLFADPALPPDIRRLRRRAYGTFYRTLAGGYFNRRKFPLFFRWAAASLASDPLQILYMVQFPVRKFRRYCSRRNANVALDWTASLTSRS